MHVETNIAESGMVISDMIKNNPSFFIGRMTGIEADALGALVGKGCVPEHLRNLLQQNTGFYCKSDAFDDVLAKWCALYLKALRSCDLLFRLEFPTWDGLVSAHYDKIYVFSCAHLHTWMPALEGKKVLVVSPFAESIRIQFPKRNDLFTTGAQDNFEYPRFDLQILECPNTIKGNDPFPHDNWVETFEAMCRKMDKIDFDLAILGCGSYGMPLAHYAKTIGRSSIYAGAYTQVMFGIKGRRWDIDGNPHRSYWNEHWKWPEESETPKNANKVENSCYWK